MGDIYHLRQDSVLDTYNRPPFFTQYKCYNNRAHNLVAMLAIKSTRKQKALSRFLLRGLMVAGPTAAHTEILPRRIKTQRKSSILFDDVNNEVRNR